MASHVMTVLAIVDDGQMEDVIHRTLQDFLIRPHTYVSAPGFWDGINKMRQEPPDIIVLHHNPQSCHAISLLEHMEHDEIRRPVIVIGRRAEGLLAADVIKQGASAFLAEEELNTPRLAHAVDEAYIAFHMQQDREEQEARLRVQNEQLQALTKAKDDFIATVSHELRTPLLNVKEGISLLLDGAHGPLAPPQEEFVRLIYDNIKQLSQFLNDLLDLSKLEAGRAKLDRRQLNFVTLTRDVSQSCRTLVAQHQFVNQVADPLPMVYADRSRITQVLTNLIGNAAKYTPVGGTITLSAAVTEAFVEVRVADNGMGISKENVGKLFEKYQQVSGASSVHKGTGLGLALCKELVELHHGTIRAESEEGQGTAFIFTLPRFTALTAFAESLTSMAAQAQKEQRGVCLAALDVTAWRAAYPNPPLAWDAIGQRLEKIVQQQIHHGEQALRVHDATCVILAVIDAAGLRTLCDRMLPLLVAELQAALNVTDALPLGFKCAVYPIDGATPEALLERAQPLLPATGKHLLIADTAADLITSARARLELGGYTVSVIATGPEALTRLQQGGIDVAVIDVQLPQLGGLELCQQLKAETATSSIPVILSAAEEVVTATFDDRCIGVGAFGWLRKPWTTQELLPLVVRALEESQQSFKW